MLSEEYRATMLGSQTSKLPENDGRKNETIENVCNFEPEHDVITGWTASDKKYFLMKHQFGSPKFHSSAKRRNKHLLRCKINRSLNFDLNFSRKDNLRRISPNSSVDNSCFSMSKPSRDLSRSAKIMRALSSDVSFRHRNESIKKSLTFDPSPNKSNNSDDNTSVDSMINTPLHTPDKSSRLDRDSTDTSIASSVPTASLESIDENQNRTPQQSRKIVKIQSNTSSTKKSAEKSESSGSSTSLLRSNLKERIDSICNIMQTPDFHCSKLGNRLRVSSCDVAASTPRNLFKEFNSDKEDSPHTPENVMQFIPEGMSSIKKSHKKERSYCVGRKALEVDDSARNTSLCAKRTTESLEADEVPTSSGSFVVSAEESPKKSRNVKKALVYNFDDEISDSEPTSDDAGRKATPKNIDSNDCEMCEENAQGICDASTSSASNRDEKENDSHLQEASSSNANLTKRRTTSEKNDSPVIRDSCAEMYAARLPSFYSLLHNVETLYNEKLLKIATPDAHRLREISKYTEATFLHELNRTSNCRIHKRHASEDERPSTPENINSSRLLLSQYKSVKKSHRKDKRKNKSISDISKDDVMAECKKSVSLLTDFKLPEGNVDECRNESFLLSSSPDGSDHKRKRFMSASLQNDELAHSPESLFSRYQSTDDEFKIYTPIRRRMSSILDKVKNFVYRGKASSGKDDEPTEAADTTDENGRLTPVNMSTAELLCNKDSIKKSHKKDKHDGSICRKRILRKKLSETMEAGDVNTASCTETSKKHATPSLKLNPNGDDSYDETRECSNIRNQNNKSNEESIYDPQPSTSRGNSFIESKKNVNKSKALITTPPNNWSTLKFMKLLHATSIKKSHKKERDLNAQSKYILMNQEYDLSDDGSIFDEEDKLINSKNSSPCQYNKD